MYLKGSDNREKEQVHFALGEGLEEGRAAASAEMTAPLMSLVFVPFLFVCLIFAYFSSLLNAF